MIFLRIRRGNYWALGLWGKSHVSAFKPFELSPNFFLTHLSLSRQSTTTLKTPDVSWGSYCWVVVGVAGLSVLSHMPTPPANSSPSRRKGKPLRMIPFWLILRQRVVLFLSCAGWDCSSRSKLRSRFLSPMISFEWALRILGCVYVCYHTYLWFWVYALPCPSWESDLLLHFGLCFLLPLLQCWDLGLLLSPRLVCCGFNYVLSRYGFSLGLFGHDRAKNDSGIVFLCQGCELHVLLYVCNGWSLDCVGLVDLLMAW